MLLITLGLITIWCSLFSGATTRNDITICDICNCRPHNDPLEIDCSRRNLGDLPLGIHKCLRVSSLDVSHNKIARLDSQTFQGLTSIISLNLSYNLITRIENNTFDSLKALKMLSLDGNRIPYNETGFSQLALRGLPSLTRLFLLTDGCPNQFPESLLYGITSLEELSIFMPSQGSLGPSFRMLTRMNTIHLTTQCPTSRKISADDIAALKGLAIRRISFRNAQLSEISPAAFYPFKESLRKLDISCNRLKNAEELILGLSGYPLQTLLMDSSLGIFLSLNINEATLNALKSMNLSRLTIAWNNFLNIDIRPGFKNLGFPGLQYFRMGYNQLAVTVNTVSDIVITAFKLLLHVRVLDISGALRFYDNRDTVLNCNEPDVLFSDRKLDWENDTLRYPPPKVPEWFYMLIVIWRYSNGVLTLPPHLTRLYARNMGQIAERLSCEDISFEIRKENNLQIVDVAYTTLPRVDCFFTNVPSLLWVNAQKMQMTSWGQGVFANLSAPQLRYVNLGGNLLGTFMATARYATLRGSSNVTDLDLSSNRIYALPSDFLSYSTELIALNLSDNTLETWNTSIRYCHQLELLILSHNSIKGIQMTYLAEFDEHIREGKNLTLQLHNNEFQCLECSNIDLFNWILTTAVTVKGMRCLDGQSRLSVDAAVLRAARWQCWGRTLLLAIVSGLTVLSVVVAVSQANKWALRYLYHCVRSRFISFDYLLPREGICVYLSYHESDSGAVEVIKKHLKMKLRVPNIVSREQCPPGRFELDEIALHIQSCTIVILLVSPELLSDSRTEFELYMSLEKGFQHVLPILLNEDLSTEIMPKALRRLLNMNNYLTWPATASDATEAEFSGRKDVQHFFVVFEACIANMVRRLGIRRLPDEQEVKDRSAQAASPDELADAENTLASIRSILGE